jgi:CO/xanthine dehydrogenase FAD-binding subunit
MDLNTVTEVLDARRPDDWRPGDVWLAGGTYLFSQPHPHLRRLLDLNDLGWTPLLATDAGIEIAATCTIGELSRYVPPGRWAAHRHLIRQCCEAFLALFKIWHVATVGGNLCTALPAGPMISLTAALEGTSTLWPRDGAPREIPVADFVTGNNKNVLQPGELLRSILLPKEALAKRFAFRRSTLTHLGRSAVLLIGTQTPQSKDLLVTITASTLRPVQLRFESAPSAKVVRDAIDAAVPDDLYLDDVHGSPPYRRHLTYYYAEQIRQELCA